MRLKNCNAVLAFTTWLLQAGVHFVIAFPPALGINSENHFQPTS